MYAYIEGMIAEKNPTFVVIDCSGVGYLINISLHTFSQIKEKTHAKLLTHHLVREDAQQLFGFFDAFERKLFLHLISVSGVGANTARMILSAMTPEETAQSILSEDVKKLQSVKGIGGKTAQRIIVDLKDRLAKEDLTAVEHFAPVNSTKDEALAALVMLGFNRIAADKALQTISKMGTATSTEEMIKQALKML